MTTPRGIILALQDLPTRYPSLIALAWALMGEDGEIDPDLAVLHAKELRDAVEEAEGLRRETRNLVSLLKQCNLKD